MGVFERVAKLVQSNVQDLLSTHEDPETLLGQAMDELEKEVATARNRLADARLHAKTRKDMVDAREEEARHFAQQASQAAKDGSKTAQAEFQAFEKKARESARTLEGEASQAHGAAQELASAVEALERTMEDARAKRVEVGARLREVRAKSGRRIEPASAPRPEREAPKTRNADAPYPGSVEDQFRNLETEAHVDTKLDELKRKMRGGG